jgi:methylglutaconyl-CoA hydratase
MHRAFRRFLGFGRGGFRGLPRLGAAAARIAPLARLPRPVSEWIVSEPARVGELVRVEVEDGVAVVTLDRPEVLNALSFETLAQLGAAAARLGADPSVRAVIFTGAGEKAFCAGADLKERAGFTEEQTRAFVARIGSSFEAVAALPMPTLAAIGGVAYGGGCELALACDLRVMAKGAQIGLTETSLAIIPGAGGTQRLPRLVGVARAKELIFTARRVGAEEALSLGLVEVLAEPGQALAKSRELAQAMARNGPLAVRAAKEAIDLVDRGGELAANLRREREIYLQRVLPSADRLEALAAFREKRPPRFSGR